MSAVGATSSPALPGKQALLEPTVAQRRQVLELGALLMASSLVTVLAALTNPPVDGWALRVLTRAGWADWLTWAQAVVSPWFVLAVAVVFLALARGCRTLQLSGAAGLVAAAGAGWSVAQVVDRLGPPVAPQLAGTYPHLGVLTLTVAAGLLPMGVFMVTDRPVARHAVRVGMALLVLAAALDQVARGRAWPLDVGGAVLLGAGAVILIRLLVENPERHGWCGADPCPGTGTRSPDRRVRPVLELDEERARLLHRVTLAWTVGLVLVYGGLAATVGLPRTAESGVMGSGLESPLQWGALTLLVVGVLIARRWHLTGAALVALAASVLAWASAMQYPPWVAVLVLLSTWAPAGMLWLEWHRRTTLRASLVIAVVTSLVLSGAVAAAASTYSSYWAPTHPTSLTPAPDMAPVEWMWVGAVTSTGAQVTLRTEPGAAVRVLITDSGDASADGSVQVATIADTRGVADAVFTGLEPDTRYTYAVEVDGELDRERVQTFRTFPQGAASFRFALGSCQVQGSNGIVHDAIRATDPLFFLSMGDWHYGNIRENDPVRFAEQYDLNLTAPAQAALYGEVPIAYMWGDHDYGPNDADRMSPSREAAMAAYRWLTPHYPLAGPDSALYQAFTVGRVRFVMMDTRASRDPATDPSGEFRSTLGADQREWLLTELASADRYGALVLVNPDPWVEAEEEGSDSWGGFAQERRVIADAIVEHDVDNLLMVSGDAHMVAFDDGTHTDYSTSGQDGFPLFHAASIDRPGSVKGGPYTVPGIPGGGQFGTIDVADDGNDVTLTLTARTWDKRVLFTEVVRFGDDS